MDGWTKLIAKRGWSARICLRFRNLAGSTTTLSGVRIKHIISFHLSLEINLFVADYHMSYFIMANNYPSYLVMADVVNRFYHYSFYHATPLSFLGI